MRRPLGVYLRWLCQLAFVVYITYLLIVGSKQIANKEKKMAGVFICSRNSNNNGNGSDETTTTQTITMTQCTGLDDTTTCSNSNDECIHSSCGRRLFPGIGISYAGTSNPFDDASSQTSSTMSFITIIAIGYSLLCPYLIGIYYICTFLSCGNVIVLTRLGMIVFASLINDILFKNIIHQYRPLGSCLYFDSYGMPSGHSVSSIGLLTYILLELFMYHPNLFGKENMFIIVNNVTEVHIGQTFMWGYGWLSSEEDRISQGESPVEHYTLDIINADDHQFENNYADEVKDDDRSHQHQLVENHYTTSEGRTNFESLENSEGGQILPEGMSTLHRQESPPQQAQLTSSMWILHYYAILWIILLLPIPLSRVYLHDHTIMQVLVGSFTGVILGSIYFYCIIRGGLCQCTKRSSSRICCMESVVTSNFGTWIGLNYGKMGGKMMMVRMVSSDVEDDEQVHQ